ncbi:hypothetical protein HDU67_007813 [Dinochytrium kinnereticum]|nr:hypothetical protein HDU67_007813 [Dinochytrium kinnereticum]
MSAPFGISEEVMMDTRDVHWDGFLGLYASPEVMESPDTQLSTYDEIDAWVTTGWAAAASFLQSPPSGPRRRRYLAVAYLDHPTGKAKGSAVSAAGVEMRYVRSTTSSTLSILRSLDESMLERAQSEASDPNLQAQPIRFIWILLRYEHTRLQAFMERVGFKPLETFLKLEPTVDRRVFERQVHVPNQLFRTFVANVKDFRAGGGSGGSAKEMEAANISVIS